MSSIVTGALKLTFGLLWKKVRDHTASKLKEAGDLTDERCRELVVRELDDIKTKLNGLARKDLLSSICFLKEGLCFLNLSLDKRNNDETSFAQEKKDLSQGQASKMMADSSKHRDEDSVLDDALVASEAIGKLKIISKERFASAKVSFQLANEKATEAFSNEALSTEDRILATKLRVISRILECLEDPDASADTCKLYLKELHDVPAVQGMFSVYMSGGVKSIFNKDQRLENVVSITVINLEVFNFTKKFTKARVYLFNWPMIDLGRSLYHPLFLNKNILCEVQKIEVETAFITQNAEIVIRQEICEIIYATVITSKEEIITMTLKGNSYNVLKITASEVEMFCSFLQESTNAWNLSLTIDEEDNIYILTGCKLFVFNAIGSMIYNSLLTFLNRHERCEIAVSKDKNIFIHDNVEQRVYVCDSSAQLKYCFSMQSKGLLLDEHLSISDENEIIATERGGGRIYTEEGNLKRRFKLPERHQVIGVAFNYATKEVIFLTEKSSWDYCLLIYSKTGEQQQTFNVPFSYCLPRIISHPSGRVALITNERNVFYL